jgi:antitoxin component YwqK of YwqJK toxin-antitoxin module
LNKESIAIIIVIILIFTAGFIALTQEAEFFIDVPETEETTEISEISEMDELAEELDFSLDFDDDYEDVPPYRGYIYAREIPNWVQPRRWFRSNAGGIAIEEMPSRLSALRHEYSLAVDFAYKEDLPDEVFPFYNDDEDYIEVRFLYENGIQSRTQWIFRDINAKQRLVAVFSEKEDRTGFIEKYDDSGLLQVEYGFLEEGKRNKTEYSFNNTMLITSAVYDWEEEAKDYFLSYIDTYLYNRSMFLRGVERRYYKDEQVSFLDEPVRLTLPSSIKKAIDDKLFLEARYNSLPEFFGAASVSKDYKMVYRTDDRNRILTQTLYDAEDKVVWVITNTWKGERIESITKREGDTVMTASYVYNSEGKVVRESNSKNGVLERVVRIDGKIEIEELYLDNVIVLRAVWDDGRKISETRIINN